jgi:hypothetical protein
MPRKNRRAAGTRGTYLRQLWWDTVQRHVAYRTDLSRLLRWLRAETAGQRRRSRARISGGAVPSVPYPSASPGDKPSAVFASLTTLRVPDRRSRRAQAAHDALRRYRAMWKRVRREPTADVAAPYLWRSNVDLQELAAFESKWGLRCPVPPVPLGLRQRQADSCAHPSHIPCGLRERVPQNSCSTSGDQQGWPCSNPGAPVESVTYRF